MSYEELRIKNLIGKGRFATVYRGFWHGDIAVKMLDMSYCSDDEKVLEKFRLEVRIYYYTDYIKI